MVKQSHVFRRMKINLFTNSLEEANHGLAAYKYEKFVEQTLKITRDPGAKEPEYMTQYQLSPLDKEKRTE